MSKNVKEFDDDGGEIIEEQIKEEELAPLEVKVVNKEVRESSPYDGHDDYEYEELLASEEDIKELEDGKI